MPTITQMTELVTGKPTVAPNAGAPVPRKLLAAFAAADMSQAEWLRLPPPRRRCQLTGLSRTTLNELVDRGVIKAVTVRQPDAQRGVKLLNRRSLLAYLETLDREQNAPEAGLGAVDTARATNEQQNGGPDVTT